MGDGSIYEVLTREQAERLADLLRYVQRVGHGSVTLRIKNGLVRFVAVDMEAELSGKALDQLHS